MNDKNKIVEMFFNRTKEVSLERLKNASSRHDLRIKNVDQDEAEKNIVKAQHIANIVLDSDNLNIEFKVYYFTSDIKELISKSFKKYYKEIPNLTAHDSMKEFCNLTAGGLKRILQEKDSGLGLSIPISYRGFDDMWEKTPDWFHRCYWKIQWSAGSILIGIQLDISNQKLFDSIDFNLNNDNDTGALEML